jgi:hypothetical protein
MKGSGMFTWDSDTCVFHMMEMSSLLCNPLSSLPIASRCLGTKSKCLSSS